MVAYRLDEYPEERQTTVSEFKDAFSTLHSTSGNGRLRIESVDCPVSNLGKYIANEDISDPDVREKLNTLAGKVNAMSALEAKTCAGALDATSINSLDDVVRVVGVTRAIQLRHGHIFTFLPLTG